MAEKIFSEQLRLVREKRNLTQHSLATISNVNRSQIGKFERGTANPTLDSLVDLAFALDVDLNDLMPMSRYKEERAAG
ncbi:helix-turn-helix domain-containing protein [Mucilaginibacter oryzae]|uniref:helix-turn-helix domain-containing protein n=1 Tax=Mucilaginibacter oryzae TaxID=468058 RepID=UPI00147518B9|nr:helix-turn-helix transcriptional regulator [Mucilaginibacter oryzae]